MNTELRSDSDLNEMRRRVENFRWSVTTIYTCGGALGLLHVWDDVVHHNSPLVMVCVTIALLLFHHYPPIRRLLDLAAFKTIQNPRHSDFGAVMICIASAWLGFVLLSLALPIVMRISPLMELAP